MTKLFKGYYVLIVVVIKMKLKKKNFFKEHLPKENFIKKNIKQFGLTFAIIA